MRYPLATEKTGKLDQILRELAKMRSSVAEHRKVFETTPRICIFSYTDHNQASREYMLGMCTLTKWKSFITRKRLSTIQ